MAHRHKMHKAKGGEVGGIPEKEGKPLAYTAKGSHVEKEAEEKKRGGRTHGKHHGKHSKHRLDKRARGGRTGSNNHPFSSAARAGDRGKRPHIHGDEV